MRIRKGKKLASELVAICLSLIILVPIYMLTVNSFKDFAGANRLSLSFAKVNLNQIIDNYRDVYEISRLGEAYKTSGIITLATVFLVIVCGSLTAFIIQRRQSRATGIVNMIFIMGLSIPFVAPTSFFLNKSLGLSQTIPGIVLVFLATSIPFSVFLFTGYLKSVPRNLDESAIIDGCGPFRLFFSIIFPLILPVTSAVVIIVALGVWNDFGVAIFLLNTPSKFTVSMTTYNFYGIKNSSWNLLFANIVLISLPVVVLYLFLQRYIVSGLTAGAIKG